MDVRRLKANQFSDMKEATSAFDDPDFLKHTLIDNEDKVQAIICFKPYWNRNYVAFFLIAEGIQISEVRELKRFIYDAIMDLGADRVQTLSPHCDKIKKWHLFLGFRHEGTHEKMAFDKDYDTWAVVRGRDY